MSSPDQPNSPRHAALKATWQPGQKWETRVEGCEQWAPVGNGGYAEPVWEHRQEYRRVPDDGVQLPPPCCRELVADLEHRAKWWRQARVERVSVDNVLAEDFARELDRAVKAIRAHGSQEVPHG